MKQRKKGIHIVVVPLFVCAVLAAVYFAAGAKKHESGTDRTENTTPSQDILSDEESADEKTPEIQSPGENKSENALSEEPRSEEGRSEETAEENGSFETGIEDGQEMQDNVQIPEGDASLDNEAEIPWDLEE